MKSIVQTKALSLLLALAMLLSLVPGMGLTVHAAEWNGEGTEASPYLISGLDDLKSLRDSVNGGTDYSGKYFKLTADIDCGTDNWVPIGKSKMGAVDITYYDFKGTFDGNGKTVTYHVANSSDNYIGLFAFFMNGATVKNLSVAGSISGSGEDYGGIVGRNYVGTIQNCSSSVSITGSDDCYGGIAGTNNGTIDHCVASGALIWNFTGRTSAYAAGITAVNGGTVNNCVSLCDISAENVSSSGYAGRVIAWQQSGTVADCYYLSTANITGNNVNASNATAKTADELKAIGETAYNAGYTVYALACGYGSHSHSFTYEASGDTITATCNDTAAHAETYTAALTIAAPQHTAVGDDKSADAQITDANNIKGDAAVSYYKANNDNTRGDALNPQTTAPTDGGKYWAEITLTNGGSGANDSATAHVVYTITNPDYNVTLPTDLVGGTVTADKTSVKYGETVTLTITPDNGFTLKSLTVKDSENADVELSGTGNTRTFTMPAANVTVSATFEGAPFDVTISNAITGGTVAVSSGLENGQAKAGSEVTLTVTPAAGYQLETLKYNNTAITASEGVYKFTMPAEAVTVTATFVGKDTTLTLSTAGNSGTTCTAKLLDSSYNEISSVTQKTGEEFILRINKDEGYSYRVSFTSNATASMREFSTDDYKAYINSTKSESLNTYLYWVTMPGVDSDTVNMTVTFATAKTFTILYQPTESASEVWVKFGYTENSQDKLVTAKMSKDATMGNVAVWSLKMSAAFNPDKIAFATSESDAESANTETAIVSETSNWSNITGGQYLIIGNNAKTVIAAFTDDSTPANVDREATVISIGDNATYQIAICASGGNGSVTTPAAPTRSGYDFVAWRGYEGITAKDYAANTQISVKENIAFSAVWQPSTPNVKLNLNGGTGIATTLTVDYNTTLPSLTPVKSGYSFAGWSVAKDVTEDGKLYTRGAPFDTGTKITADLELTAQWKHVHAYGCIQIEAVSSLAAKYAAYAPYLHIKICGCGDVDLEAHSLNSDGVCACGYSKSGATPTNATLDVSYVRQSDNHTMMAELPETVAADSEVSVSAPGKWGNLTFSKWQYKAEGDADWTDAGAYKMMSFVIPGNMEMRALYVNATAVPEVSMSATTYETTASDGNLYDSILFQMNYKLPDGYTYVDAGVRSGDNAGISYYELKERTATMDAEAKAITYSLAAAMSVLSGELTTFDTSGTEQYYAKRENSVLEESGMTAAKLGEYMYQSKPINIKDPPLYWNYKPTVTGQSGSINALTPVGFAQRNNGNHYIYAIAYLTYKDSSGTTHTIYTPALATTLNGISSAGTVSKSGS